MIFSASDSNKDVKPQPTGAAVATSGKKEVKQKKKKDGKKKNAVDAPSAKSTGNYGVLQFFFQSLVNPRYWLDMMRGVEH